MPGCSSWLRPLNNRAYLHLSSPRFTRGPLRSIPGFDLAGRDLSSRTALFLLIFQATPLVLLEIIYKRQFIMIHQCGDCTDGCCSLNRTYPLSDSPQENFLSDLSIKKSCVLLSTCCLVLCHGRDTVNLVMDQISLLN